MALIEMQDITRVYRIGGGTLPVLKGISLTIEAGEFVAIMGASGSGKSTLMQIMGLLDRPSAGTYRLAGQEVGGLSDDATAALRSETIGFIFQMFNLLARTTTIDNVILPMIYAGRIDRVARATQLLTDVGLADRLTHHPNQLSGGQQQRVAIARALANAPRLLFADEPTGNLASAQADEILARLTALNEAGTTIVMVTHEAEIAAYAKRTIYIKDGQIVGDERRFPVGVEAPLTSLPGKRASATGWRQGLAELGEQTRSAWRAVGANKARSGLSALGILIGVASVIVMLALGRGAQKAIESRLESLGSNVVMMFAGAPSSRGVRGAIGSYTRLTLEDARAIQKLPDVAALYPEVEADVRMVYGAKNEVAEVQGVTPNYERIRNATPPAGRFFTEQENLAASRVVVLGQTVVRNLFGTEDPLRKTIKFNRQDFNVIGLLPSRGGSGFSDQDDMAIIPLTTGIRRVMGTPYLHEMAIQCATTEGIPAMLEEIRSLMRHRHRLPFYKEDDFTLRNNAEVQSALSDTTRTFGALLGIVAAMSLFVGGVGVMNIMLVSVNERTREIGLRKALGATRRAVLMQFLLESLMLSILGGVVGVVLAGGVVIALSAFAGWTAIIQASYVLTAFGFSAATGVLFGYWPAYKASRLSPIEALRYE